MIYRKASPQPARLLLRVVATASALAAVAACSSSSPGGEGTQKDSGAETGPCGNGVCGSVADPEAGGGLSRGGTCEVTVDPDAGGGFVGNGACDGGGDVIVPEESSTFDGPVGVIPIDAGSDH